MIPVLMLRVRIKSGYDSRDDSMRSHCIMPSSIGCQEDFHRWRLPMRHGDISLLVNSCLTIQPMIFTTSSRSFCSHQIFCQRLFLDQLSQATDPLSESCL